MAILCEEAVKVFIDASEGSFFKVGTVLENTDLMLIREDPVKKVLVTQNKFYQEDLVKSRFGAQTEIIPAMANAIPYALTSGQADAAILDFKKAMELEQTLQMEPASDAAYPAFALISNREWSKGKEYSAFIRAYNQVVDRLESDPDVLKQEFEQYLGKSVPMERWKLWKIKINKLSIPD